MLSQPLGAPDADWDDASSMVEVEDTSKPPATTGADALATVGAEPSRTPQADKKLAPTIAIALSSSMPLCPPSPRTPKLGPKLA